MAGIDSEEQQAFGGGLVTQSTQWPQATEAAWLFLGVYLQRDNGVNSMKRIEKLKGAVGGGGAGGMVYLCLSEVLLP